MALKKLVEVWDGKDIIEKNIIFLKKKTKDIRLPISDATKKILKDLLDTYIAVPCAGIAANQIGYDKRIFIGLKDDTDDEKDDQKEQTIGNPNAENYEFYINPQIDHTSNKSIQEGEEGCLSIPEIRLVAERFDKIKVRYFNEKGEKVKKPLSGFLSRLFQHELDHLNGVLMVENSKIKSVYRISENKEVENLYVNLINKIAEFK
tara:strand:- start:2078 stop:2692 length:615 start_codon:yes stop_codon:yes gene_type:complete